MVLPPDLSRLGDELTGAAARALAARRRRRVLLGRGAATALAGILTVAALSPAALGPAQHVPGGAASPASDAGVLATVSVGRGCDQGRGSRFRLPACGRTSSADERAPATPDPATPGPRARFPSRI